MKAFLFVLIIGAAVALCIEMPKLMVNPGQLSRGHQKNAKQCTSCHQLFWGIPDKKCIACHKINEIGKDSVRTEASLQFHKRLKEQSCTSCHTDHKGIDPNLATIAFDHDLLSATMLKNCLSCHVKPTDTLHAQISVSCSGCHNTNEWKFSGDFDHNLISEVNKNNCISCHQKPSDGFHFSLKSNCLDCHSTQQWKPATFDHSTYFVLDRHHDAKCITCHANNLFTSYTCYGCHEHSEGKIAEEHREEGVFEFADCASCHKSGNKHDIRFDEGRSDKRMDGVRQYIQRERKREGQKKEHDDD
jgi:hypothetical protein